MPQPQVNDRLKEIPAQALRTLFASIGQLLLLAERLRARAAEQLSGSGEATAAPPSDQAPAAATPAAPPAAPAAPAAPGQDAETARWRSLDKTGNVRLLGGDEEQDEDLAVPASPESSPGEPVTQATPEPAPAGYTPTEPVPAVSEPADLAPAVSEPADLAPAVPDAAELTPVPDPADLAPAVPEPADLSPAEPAPADLSPAVPDPAELVPAEPDLAAPAPAVVPGEALPVPNYDQLSVPSLRARLRVLDMSQVQVLLDYEKAHEGRPAVITMFERRLTKLSEGH